MVGLKASSEGKKRIKLAVKLKGWHQSDDRWLELVSAESNSKWQKGDVYPENISRKTLDRFFQCKEAIKPEAFKAFCGMLKLNWTEIVDLSSEIELSEIQKQSIYKLESGCRHEKLFGRDKEIKAISENLLKDRGRGILSIDGIGGVGKTALAREIAINALKTGKFESVVWESAKLEEIGITGLVPARQSVVNIGYLLEQIASQLNHPEINEIRDLDRKTNFVQEILNAKTYLIVIDNLETVENYAKIIDIIQGLFSVSKALITTRQVVGGSNNIQAFPIYGLDKKDSIEFFRTYAQNCGDRSRAVVEKMSEDRISEIHELIGGLPLAIELIVGQLELGNSLSNIINGLQSNNYTIITDDQANDEDIFRRFYLNLFQSSWTNLEDNDRRLLVSLNQFDCIKIGAEREKLFRVFKRMTDVNSNQFDSIIAKLIQCSLVKKEIKENDDIYYIHPLTNQFIKEV